MATKNTMNAEIKMDKRIFARPWQGRVRVEVNPFSLQSSASGLVSFSLVVDGDRGTSAEAQPLLGAALGARDLNDTKRIDDRHVVAG